MKCRTKLIWAEHTFICRLEAGHPGEHIGVTAEGQHTNFARNVKLEVSGNHKFNDQNFCTKCHMSLEKAEKGWNCGMQRCKECTLMRQCVGDPPICLECYRRENE
jgi:hypothetical protein